MREDMNEVFHDRPRAGRGDGELTSRHARRTAKVEIAHGDPDFIESRQAIKAPSRHKKCDRKHARENDRPLIRFLLGAVGRRWDDVYSEICANINLHADQSAKARIENTVVQNVKMIDGKPHEFCAYSWRTDRSDDGWVPLTFNRYGGSSSCWSSLYVDPRDGILKKAPEKEKTETYSEAEQSEYLRNRFFPDNEPLTRYYRIDGIWYEIGFRYLVGDEIRRGEAGRYEMLNRRPSGMYYSLAPEPEHKEKKRYWVREGCSRAMDKIWVTLGNFKGMHPVSKRQLNSKEARRIEACVEQQVRDAKRRAA